MSDDDTLLESFFEQARAARPGLPPALQARILADAAALAPPVPAPAGWRGLVDDLLMGWYGLGGLAAASVAGLWLGFAPPAGLPDAGAVLLGQSGGAVDLFDPTGLSAILAEEG